MDVVTKPSELVIVELFVVVRYNSVRYSILIDGILIHELFDFSRRDGSKYFAFDPFGEVVDSYHNILYITSSFRELAN